MSRCLLVLLLYCAFVCCFVLLCQAQREQSPTLAELKELEEKTRTEIDAAAAQADYARAGALQVKGILSSMWFVFHGLIYNILTAHAKSQALAFAKVSPSLDWMLFGRSEAFVPSPPLLADCLAGCLSSVSSVRRAGGH